MSNERGTRSTEEGIFMKTTFFRIPRSELRIKNSNDVPFKEGNMNTKWKLAAAAMVMVLGMGMKAEAANGNSPANATITVTPVADVSLTISPTTYAFGNLDIN